MVTLDRSGPRLRAATYPVWWRVLLGGLLLWLACVGVTGLTGNLIMVPTVILLGSFLVPVTAVIWYLDHYDSPVLTARHVIAAFIVGGTLGVLAASLLESWLLRDGVLIYLGVGLIEEFAKFLGLWFIARRLGRYLVRDGIVLGAAVGFGFAALESSGYAFAAMIVREGHAVTFSLGSLVFTELVRGVLAPLGHGLWTAILGGVLFGASRPAGHLRVTGRVVGTYLLVSLLHGLWDAMDGIALVLTAILTATPARQIAVTTGERADPTPEQLHTFLAIEYGGLVLISAIGLLLLWRLWHGSDPVRSPVRAEAPAG